MELSHRQENTVCINGNTYEKRLMGDVPQNYKSQGNETFISKETEAPCHNFVEHYTCS